MRTKGLLSIVVAGLVASSMARPAGAQHVPKGELSGGYQFINMSSEGESESMPKGWYFDVAGNLTRSIGIVAAVGGNYKSLAQSVDIDGTVVNANADLRIHEFMGGTRFSARANPNVVPFGHFLAGGVNASTSYSGTARYQGQIFSSSGSDSATNFALRAGGGVNINFTRRIGVRFEADYLRIFGSEADANVFRFGTGINIPF